MKDIKTFEILQDYLIAKDLQGTMIDYLIDNGIESPLDKIKSNEVSDDEYFKSYEDVIPIEQLLTILKAIQ